MNTNTTNTKSLTKRAGLAAVLLALAGVLGGLAAGEVTATPTTDPGTVVAQGGFAERRILENDTQDVAKKTDLSEAGRTAPPPPPPPPPPPK